MPELQYLIKCILIKHKKNCKPIQSEYSNIPKRALWTNSEDMDELELREDLLPSLAGSQLRPYLTDASSYGFTAPLLYLLI